MYAEPLRVVLCWHMHQPDYRDPLDGRFLSPWTYLHAIKDYSDMAAHLEHAPSGVRAVINFPPVLLEQLTDYAERISAFLTRGAEMGDPLLQALASRELPTDSEPRRALLERCLQANSYHMIDRFPAFGRLAAITRKALETDSGVAYLSDRFLFDLLTWYHLAWLGEIVRRHDARAKALLNKAQDFTVEDRLTLLTLISELMTALPERYRKLAADGRIELSTSPATHTMLPLLLDLAVAREAQPDLPLPESDGYPGGRERVGWQLRQSREAFERIFGAPPTGCWPSEGGVSDAALELIGEHRFQWAASGQGVLHHSLTEAHHPDSDTLHRPYRTAPEAPPCFFRDDMLSDLIGFEYKNWHADDAVADLVNRLEEIADQGGPGRVVSIILDGENPWEHYPHNGYHFVPALYRALVESPRLHLTTFSECVHNADVPVESLPHVVAGSWVYGQFDTWIGHADPGSG